MTKEETEKRIEVMQAYVDGKELQVICRDMKTWEDVVDPNWEWGHLDYRVKPAPKFRPFDNVVECFNEMKKHMPFGWVKDDFSFFPIEKVSYVYDEFIRCLGVWTAPDEMFEKFTFLDGSPFGIKEEEELL